MLTPTMIQAHLARRSASGEWEFLALRRSASERVYPGVWQAVTGMIETGETALEAARREIAEETGLRPATLWVLPYVGSFFSAAANEIVFVPCFGGVVGEAASPALSDEHSEYAWLTAEETWARLPIPSHREATDVFLRDILCRLDTAPFARF